MPTFETFIIARVVNAFVVIALFETYFTYLLEFVGGKYKAIIGIGVEFIWVTGLLTLALLGMFIRIINVSLPNWMLTLLLLCQFCD